jgi:hypothetical protein
VLFIKQKEIIMKKILAIMAMAFSGSLFAASATLEYQAQNGVDSGTDNNVYQVSVKEDINKNFAGDVVFNQTIKDTTNGLSSTRMEAGLTGKTSLGVFSPYLRVATGQKTTSTTNFNYYSVEPGITAPIGSTGLTARLGYRFRDAYNDAVNADLTRTVRAGLSYTLTKNDAVGVRYDRVRGDTNSNNVAINYTRSF